MCIVNPLSINDYNMNVTTLTFQIEPWTYSSEVSSLCFISSNRNGVELSGSDVELWTLD